MVLRRSSPILHINKNLQKNLRYAPGYVIMNSDDEEWITVKGTPVRVEDGELQGEVGERISTPDKSKSYENGKKSKLGTKDVEKYTDRLVGQKTSTGTEITEISEHVFDRIAERRITPKRFEDMMSKTPTVDKTFPERDVYADRGAGLVINRDTGLMVTVMWGRKLK